MQTERKVSLSNKIILLLRPRRNVKTMLDFGENVGGLATELSNFVAFSNS